MEQNFIQKKITYKPKRFSKKAVAQFSEHFRPTKEVSEFLETIEEINGREKSKTINEAILLLKEYRTEPIELLRKLRIKYPIIWKGINRIKNINTYRVGEKIKW